MCDRWGWHSSPWVLEGISHGANPEGCWGELSRQRGSLEEWKGSWWGGRRGCAKGWT